MNELTDNRDRNILEYLDHSGLFKKLSDKLPTFGKADVWMYTCLPLLLRSLSLGDEKSLETILKTCCNLKTVEFSADSGKLCFFKDLFTIFPKIGFVDIEKLKSLVVSIEFTVSKLSPATAYAIMSRCEFEIEKIRWILLAIGSCLRGFSQKLKTKFLADFSNLTDMLSEKLDGFSLFCEFEDWEDQEMKYSDLITFDKVKEAAKLLQRNWEKSSNGIVILINGCQELITEIRKLA